MALPLFYAYEIGSHLSFDLWLFSFLLFTFSGTFSRFAIWQWKSSFFIYFNTHLQTNYMMLTLFNVSSQALRFNFQRRGVLGATDSFLWMRRMMMASSRTTTSRPVSKWGLREQWKTRRTQMTRRRRWMKLCSVLLNKTVPRLSLFTGRLSSISNTPTFFYSVYFLDSNERTDHHQYGIIDTGDLL